MNWSENIMWIMAKPLLDKLIVIMIFNKLAIIPQSGKNKGILMSLLHIIH